MATIPELPADLPTESTEQSAPKPKRRRSRRRKKPANGEAAQSLDAALPDFPQFLDDAFGAESAIAVDTVEPGEGGDLGVATGPGDAVKPARRTRRGRSGQAALKQLAVAAPLLDVEALPTADAADDAPEANAPEADAAAAGDEANPAPAKKRRRSRRRKKPANGEAKALAEGAETPLTAEGQELMDAEAPLAPDGADAPYIADSGVAEDLDDIDAPGAPGALKYLDYEGDDDEDDEPASSAKLARRRKMFLSVLPDEQIELALAEDGKLQEYYVELLHHAKIKGNIYKGYIHNIDSGLQAAFVNYGAVKNGFLQIDEVHADYYQSGYQLQKGQRFPPIQKVLKPGQEILVQVVKEPMGTKGAFLTTYLSLAGRYFVLTPGREQLGVSRKIEDDEERRRLKEMAAGIEAGEGLGLIIRTVSEGQTKTGLKKDVEYLKRLWTDIRKRGQEATAPSLIYQEMELTSRAVRDYLTQDVYEVWVDDAETAEQVGELVKLNFPRRQNMVKVHTDTDMTLFERFGLQRQIDQIFSRTVNLPGGGQIVIDHTEALTAIDINSGRSAGKKSFRDMIHKNNLEAAEEIVRQLRLRDIGGQVVIDFVEMKDSKLMREVEKTVKQAMKTDRARTDVGRISRFGLMELVRQKMGSSAISQSWEPCPVCKGMGQRRHMEWQALGALKDIYRRLRGKKDTEPLVYQTTPELAAHLLNHKREKLGEMEERFATAIRIAW